MRPPTGTGNDAWAEPNPSYDCGLSAALFAESEGKMNLWYTRNFANQKKMLTNKNANPIRTRWSRWPTGMILAMAPVATAVKTMLAAEVAQYRTTWRPTRVRSASFQIQ